MSLFRYQDVMAVLRDATHFTSGFIAEGLGSFFDVLMSEKGELRCTTQIENTVTHKDGSHFARAAQVTLEGSGQWEFLPDEKGEMIDFVGAFPITPAGRAPAPRRRYARTGPLDGLGRIGPP